MSWHLKDITSVKFKHTTILIFSISLFVSFDNYDTRDREKIKLTMNIIILSILFELFRINAEKIWDTNKNSLPVC